MCSEPQLQRSLMMQYEQVLAQTLQVCDTFTIYISFGFCTFPTYSVHCTFRDLQLLTDSLWLPRSIIQPIVKRLGSTGDVDRCIVVNILLSKWVEIRKNKYFEIFGLGILPVCCLMELATFSVPRGQICSDLCPHWFPAPKPHCIWHQG